MLLQQASIVSVSSTICRNKQFLYKTLPAVPIGRPDWLTDIFMKYTTAASTAYESPENWVIKINSNELICTSPTGTGNESYEDGDTSGWYNN